MTLDKPVAIGIGIAALVALYVAFKVSKFIMKIVLLLAVSVGISLVVWWYFTKHHGG